MKNGNSPNTKKPKDASASNNRITVEELSRRYEFLSELLKDYWGDDEPADEPAPSPKANSKTNTDSTMAFLNALFGECDGPVNLCTLRNNAGGAGAQITSSDTEELQKFILAENRKGWGVYTCVSTMLPGPDPESKKGEPYHHCKEAINETPSLHADIDTKDLALGETKDNVVKILKTLCGVSGKSRAPSLIVDSGNGIHCYWKLTEAFTYSDDPDKRLDDIDRIETALKLLCDLVGGDFKVTQPSAVMRLPGSHNTKHKGQNHLVTILDQNDNVFELDDLEEWLSETSVKILRKERPRGKTVKEADGDSSMAGRYERLAEQAKKDGYKPPIDYEKRLDDMMYMAEGDASIHETQVQVSASLLEAGVDVDDVVQIILDATVIAAGDYGKNWNWTKGKRSEQSQLHYMCETWLKKHPKKDKPKKQRAKSDDKASSSSSGAQSSSGPQSSGPHPQSTSGPSTVKDKTEPFYITVAKNFFVDLENMGHDLRIFKDSKGNESLWRYENGLWIFMLNTDAWLDGEIETIIQDGLKASNKSSNRVCSEARKYILRSPNVRKMQLETFDRHGLIPVMGNLIDPLTSKVRAIKKEDYCTYTLDVEFNPDAKCPWWLQMLEDVFEDKSEEDKKENIELLQDFGGASLVNKKGKGLRRALVIYGDSNSGKTSLVDVMSGMITDEPITTSIADLNNTHGTQSFIRRVPWVLQEAFNQGIWHVSDTAKKILSGEPFEINPKGKSAIMMRFMSPTYWPTNHAPKFKEATKAMINRMTVIHVTGEFKVDEERGAMVEARKHGHSEPQHFVLETEKSGILNWMLEGAKRVLPRGCYKDTKDGLKILRDIRLDSNYAVGFVGDCCDFDAAFMISIPDLHLAFSNWYKENHGDDRVPSPVTFGRFLSAMSHPLIAIDRDRFKEADGKRFIVGIKLNKAGESHWEEEHDGMVQSSVSPSRVSSNFSHVGQLHNGKWDDHPDIIRIRLNAAKKKTKPRL
jgi:phage/plasmid-associated DNA primase